LRLAVFFILFLTAQLAALPAATWFVDGGNTIGPWDGTAQNPFQHIQDGIDAAWHGDMVRVKPGTYLENIDFSGKVIAVMSEQGPGDTWIDGGQVSSVVTFDTREGSGTVLRGFTLTNGFNTFGGGILCDGASPLIQGNVIRLNGATRYGSGIYCFDSAATIEGNFITENLTLQYYGAGIYCGYLSSLTITSNVITQNWAGSLGGGIYCRRSYTDMSNNIIAMNTAQDQGGGIYCKIDEPAPSVLTNNTICNNTAGNSGGGIYCFSSSSPVIINTIIWGNEASQGPQLFAEPGSVPVVTWCDIQGGWSGTGNIDVDPLFRKPAAGNYHLEAGSPCIDAGDSNAPLLPVLDFEGDPRIFPGNGFGHLVGSPPQPAKVDMGADEHFRMKRVKFIQK
jgi:parallel beta-helix repeat protein